uniref:AsmA family protein n=1 Tax=Polynucleobacter necessarius subsp. necessarius (strain STIR1) TaxID=452638 RepID=B1XVC6_POLNS
MACLALLALGAWFAASFVNTSQLTKLLSSSVQEITGRELKITGPVSLNFFPSISVKTEQVSLSNVPWASNPEMLTVKQLELDISIWPLLKGDVEISRIALVGVDANLQTNKAGVGNWNLTPPVLNQNISSGQSVATPDSASDSSFVTLKTLDVIDAQINYQDDNQAPKIILIPKLSLGSSEGRVMILMDAQYAKHSLNLKGKTSSLRNAYFAWNQSPLKMDLDLVLTLNGKSLAITGDIDKTPQVLPQFNVSLISKSFDLAPLIG